MMSYRKNALRVFGALGVALFLPLIAITFADNQSIERAAQSFVEWKLNKEVAKRVDTIEIPDTNKIGAALNNLLGDRIEEIKQKLKDETPKLIVAEIAKMRDLSCECRQKWEQKIAASLKMELSTLQSAQARLADFVQGKYMEVVTNLKVDVRIFLGVNAAAFLLLLWASFWRSQAIAQLFVPGVLLFASTLICSYFYLFEQNWFYTILYNDYTGFAYLGYLTIVFAFLLDIVFNRARVTTEIVNGILNVVGSAASVVPIPC